MKGKLVSLSLTSLAILVNGYEREIFSTAIGSIEKRGDGSLRGRYCKGSDSSSPAAMPKAPHPRGGILHRDDVLERVRIDARPAFDQMQVLARPLEVRPFIVSGRAIPRACEGQGVDRQASQC